MFSLGKSLTPPTTLVIPQPKIWSLPPYGIQLHFLTTKLLLEICLDWQCTLLGSSYALKIQKGVWFGEAKFLLQMLVLLLRNTDNSIHFTYLFDYYICTLVVYF